MADIALASCPPSRNFNTLEEGIIIIHIIDKCIAKRIAYKLHAKFIYM